MPPHRHRRGNRARLRAAGRNLLAFLFSNVGVVVLVVAYTIAGAFMFQAIEGSSEIERANNMERERENLVQYLWQNVTLVYNPINETAKEKISVALHSYQHTVALSIRRGWDGGRMRGHWSFSSAFLYSLTVITTIGYGHLSPRTPWGKVSTVFYALLGMPLFLLYLTNVGALLARWCKCLYALLCLCRGCPGFTRRRVARMRTQMEISEPESIEQPEDWINRYSYSDASSEFFPPIRYPSRTFKSSPERRIPSHSRYPVDSIHRGYRFEADPRHELDFRCLAQMDGHGYGTYPHRYNQRRPDYLRSASMSQPWSPRPPGPAAPAPPRGCSEPAPTHGTSDSSDFSYVTFDAQTITVPISVCVAIMVGYLMFGSMIFGMWEKWDQLDGAYFCFISLSSIGFGDFVPGERVYTPRIETSFIVCSLYLTLGMALVAMCFNLMQEQVISYVAGLKRAVKRICRCKR